MFNMKQVFIAVVMFFALSTIAQTKKEVYNLFSEGNYEGALEELLELYELEQDNDEYAYFIGVCYLNTNIDKSMAVNYLEQAASSSKPNENAVYLLGRAYHFAYRFDDAIKSYQKFKETAKSTNLNLITVDKQIEYCENAKEFFKFPANVSFENLGKNVNSAYPDYYPFIPSNESYLIFNSQRDEQSSPMGNGQYMANIYLAPVKEGKFAPAKLINFNINTVEENEEVVGLNSSGDKAIIYKEDFQKGSALYECAVTEKRLESEMILPKTINSKYTEIAASLSSDGTKMYFASDRPGGYGGVDIYMCQRLPNGQWSQALNLGPTINTEEDEDFPNISPDGMTLFFSSKGHTSMGGYDIFKASWNSVKRRFVSVRNIGYPINTPEDNMNFRVSASGRYGYISALRKGGLGDLDIYRVTFNEVEPEYTIVTGNIISSEENGTFDNAFISVIDEETGEVYGDYIPNLQTMRFVMILPPGKYEILVESDGYEELLENVEVLDKSSYRSFIEKNFKLTTIQD